jgi:hypothetical protein
MKTAHSFMALHFQSGPTSFLLRHEREAAEKVSLVNGAIAGVQFFFVDFTDVF